MARDEAFANMENSVVFDSNQLELGKITDFTFDSDYKLRQFVIKGNNGAIQEALQIESEYLLLLPIEVIRRTTEDEVYISAEFRDLKTIQDVDDNLYRFTIFRRTDVFASDKDMLGTVSDAIFHKDNHFSLVLGGTPFKSFLSRIGFSPQLQLLVPYRYISRFGYDFIILSKKRDDLGKVLNSEVLDTDGYRIMEARKMASKDSRLLLFKESYLDAIRTSQNTSY